MTAEVSDNSQLVALSLAGDQDAFRRIVERYQNLVCALALGACGNVAKSEDLTQETFLLAWQRLRELEEPAHLKAWLCGIVRNLARNASRKRGTSEVSANELEEGGVAAVDRALAPADVLAAREEAAIVDQALVAMPEMYREPLVLFYREDQSVQSVAEVMGVSSDVVRQRLSRGRNMLREQVEAVIERSLRNTRPTSALTLAIMAALPGVATQAQAAVVAEIAAKAAPVAKPVIGWSLLSAAAAPLITLVMLPFVARWAERSGKSPREKRYLVRHTWAIGGIALAAGVVIGLLTYDPSFILSHPVWFGLILLATIVFQVVAIWVVSVRANKQLKRIRREEQQ